MEANLEEIIMKLIVHAGDARSQCIMAVRSARAGAFEQAEQQLRDAEDALSNAHEEQTKLLFGEASGGTASVSLLMVHAQDHVMNAMTIKDMAVEMVAMLKELKA